MAANLDDGEFWLPPQFLTDDDILMDYNNGSNSKGDKFSRERDTGFYFPHEYSYGLGSFAPYSDLSSPVESVVGSTETESDEEDYIAELTRKMAHSTLQDHYWKGEIGLGYEKQKSSTLSGSPQSTLCPVLGGCGCKPGSSRGSPNAPSQMSSPPPAALMGRNEADWDLLYAAAGEVAKMRLIEEGSTGYYHNRGLLGLPRKPSPVAVPLKNLNPTPNAGLHCNQSLSYQQLQVAHFQQLKQQQMMKQQGSVIWGQSKGTGQYQPQQTHQMVQNRVKNSGVRPPGLSLSAWPTLQQSQQQQQQQQQPQPGSGMRAVFLGNPASKKECAGTGVFLPRRIGNPTETRKKPACSTVLLPDRVVQALNLDAMDAQPHLQARFNASFVPDYDAADKYRNNILAAQQRRNVRPQPAGYQEVRLPQEWTY
uniref:Uncharacterized protein n=1 Tax=Davidia involucrata TaxID=16924 RepID=A0A5B7A8E9_DAVIN